MQLPDDKGIYVLISVVSQMKRLEIGRLGRFDVIPGFYAYVGSAGGPGGIRACVQEHFDSVAQPHWHIDHLLGIATPLEVWFAQSDRRLEQDWAELLEKAPFFRQPVARFGSSDYRRSRTRHLFYAKRRPSFRWFEQKATQIFEPDILPQRAILPHPRER